ncbi:MAG: aspartate-semialdehyde dehydrogenase [Candidatus Euphemobacter frigidus]|nr:aspartate-semialdehyde dehydrogenase [Candidatus Euphemobacter frigidus]MDP8274862.1 aspartate-semialdehyde dehydrogenase [Candidatus Euphemobacter frigidus]
MSKKYNVVLVGIGAVGAEMLKILDQRNFPIDQLKILARSSREEEIGGRTYEVRAAAEEELDGAHFVFFAGTEGAKGASATYAPPAIKRGAVVIDNGADFRLDPDVPLIIPEVNPEDIGKHRGLIASPNCSTIQMLMAVAPLYRVSRVTRIIASTYQAVSGTGRDAICELREQSPKVLAGELDIECHVYPHQIAFNVIPQIGSFKEFGFTTEEWKMDRETRKMLHDDSIRISTTAVRVPVFNGHAESVYIETEKPIVVERVREILGEAPGVVLIDDSENARYPMPIEASGEDGVYVGRIRRDPYVKNGLHLWIVSDNIRKGAALNVIQIAERMIADGLV